MLHIFVILVQKCTKGFSTFSSGGEKVAKRDLFLTFLRKEKSYKRVTERTIVYESEHSERPLRVPDVC